MNVCYEQLVFICVVGMKEWELDEDSLIWMKILFYCFCTVFVFLWVIIIIKWLIFNSSQLRWWYMMRNIFYWMLRMSFCHVRILFFQLGLSELDVSWTFLLCISRQKVKKKFFWTILILDFDEIKVVKIKHPLSSFKMTSINRILKFWTSVISFNF